MAVPAAGAGMAGAKGGWQWGARGMGGEKKKKKSRAGATHGGAGRAPGPQRDVGGKGCRKGDGGQSGPGAEEGGARAGGGGGAAMPVACKEGQNVRLEEKRKRHKEITRKLHFSKRKGPYIVGLRDKKTQIATQTRGRGQVRNRQKAIAKAIAWAWF